MLIKSDQPFLPAQIITAGNLSAMYESGRIRYIRLGNVELVRTIYFALRDHKWDTIPYIIQDFQFQQESDHFEITFLAVFDSPGIQYKAEVAIRGAKDNTLEFSFSGLAGSTFSSSRIGICVHHPVDNFAGMSVSILGSGGRRTLTTVPETISPHQPLLDIQKLEWNTTESASASLEFEGEIFETEDQRNWTDASFKTYCTPLALPYPVTTKEGSGILQRVILSAKPGKSSSARASSTGGNEKKTFPLIGYTRGEGQPRLTEEEIGLFQKIPFEVYRVELKLHDPNWKQILEDASYECRHIGCKIQLAVFFEKFSNEEFTSLLKALTPVRKQLSGLLILSANQKVVAGNEYAKAYAELKNILQDLDIGYGTNNYFVELNRNRPVGLPADFLSFSFHPQVHATDNRSILENLGSQKDTVDTIAKFAPGAPVQISPITFTARFNPDDPDAGPLPADPRQYTSFAAWWTLKTIANVAKAKSLVLYQLLGDWGLIRKSGAGYEFSKIYELLEKIKSFGPAYIASDPDAVSEVVIENMSGEQMHFTTDMTDPRMA